MFLTDWNILGFSFSLSIVEVTFVLIGVCHDMSIFLCFSCFKFNRLICRIFKKLYVSDIGLYMLNALPIEDGKGHLGSLELELQEVLTCLTWVL